MKLYRHVMLAAGAALLALSAGSAAAQPAPLEITTPMTPPEWALLERTLLKSESDGAERFFRRYFDPASGYLLAVERWGANDGPDDAIENINNWPQLYALGGADSVRVMIDKVYEGHVRQYTQAKTTQVPFAKEGMYYREFPVMMDWMHNGEGTNAFNTFGLVDPNNPRLRDRIRRFADLYVDPAYGNYDPKNRIIKSMFNGSRGALMRRTTPLDWVGDPIDVSRFDPAAVLHGESNFDQMLAHYKDYGDTLGDNPLNLESTALALNAYILSHDAKYKDWVFEYVGAWRDRARANNNLIPSNIGLDGKIGGAVGGKWYGGTYGWAFSPVVPQTGKREDRNRGPRAVNAFMAAYFLSGGDDSWLDVWRKQTDAINAQSKTVDGKVSTPRMYGDNGWYGYTPGLYNVGATDIYLLTMKPSDRARAPGDPWLLYLEGKNAGYPAQALRRDLEAARANIDKIYRDRTTPDTRLADTVMDQNPARVSSLVQLMTGGNHAGTPSWSRARLRYFDPAKRRPGIPEDVAALVDGLTADTVTVSLVNLNQDAERVVTIQGGSYGEHQILSISDGKVSRPVNARSTDVRLTPGAGARLTLQMKRYANQPTLDLPWPQ